MEKVVVYPKGMFGAELVEYQFEQHKKTYTIPELIRFNVNKVRIYKSNFGLRLTYTYNGGQVLLNKYINLAAYKGATIGELLQELNGRMIHTRKCLIFP